MDHPSRRRILQGSLALAGLGLLAGCGVPPPFAQAASGSPKVPRIGYLGALTLAQGFREALAGRGYVEGQSIVIEWRGDEGRPERLAQNVAELINLNVDLIVAAGTDRALAVKKATATIPIVLTSGVDPVGAGLIESFAQPGGNVTGHVESHPQLAGKQLELLREIAPGIVHVTALGQQTLTGGARYDELEAAARTLGLQLRPLRVSGPDALAAALASETGERTDALLVVHSGLIQSQQTHIFEFAARKRLPAMYGRSSYAETGGLASYGPNLADLYHRTAALVDRILRGARPAELPVELPSRFDFVINLKTARALGLAIPQSVLIQATELIQ